MTGKIIACTAIGAIVGMALAYTGKLDSAANHMPRTLETSQSEMQADEIMYYAEPVTIVGSRPNTRQQSAAQHVSTWTCGEPQSLKWDAVQTVRYCEFR